MKLNRIVLVSRGVAGVNAGAGQEVRGLDSLQPDKIYSWDCTAREQRKVAAKRRAGTRDYGTPAENPER